MKIDGREVNVTHPDKVLFPDSGITKGDLIDYYQKVAPVMLPHLKDRPVTLQRFPNGIESGGFFQKQASDYFPDWIKVAQIDLLQEEQDQQQVVVDSAATLVYLANQAAITLHAWLSRVDKLHYPDRIIFDLDPPDSDFGLVREAARELRQMLEEVGLVPFLMTTGSRGLHVVAPLDRSVEFDQVREFAKDLADVAASRRPDKLTTEVRKDARRGRLFLDYLRNSYAQTAVAPYSVRAKPGAPVAAPLLWEELSESAMRSGRFTIRNIFERLDRRGDPWQDMLSHAKPLRIAYGKLRKLQSERAS